jgi:sugar phosphate isomerase/epimerase
MEKRMRLGIVGMLPGDFRTFTKTQMAALRALTFTGFGFHLNGDAVFDITTADCRHYHQLMAGEGLDLAQFAITYNDCLFHPDQALRARAIVKINRGTEIAAQLGAQAFLLRPGGLNPAGPWAPHRDNHRPENTARLVETLKPIAQKAEQEGVLLALETHAVSVMDPPEKCRAIIEAVGSNHLRLIMDAVNHFQCLQQVYHSTEWINHIFDVMGPIAPLAHLKDLKVSNGLVLHIDQEVPGEGELDLALVLRRFDALYPAGYGLIEHLPLAQIPQAVANIRRIAAENGITIA